MTGFRLHIAAVVGSLKTQGVKAEGWFHNVFAEVKVCKGYTYSYCFAKRMITVYPCRDFREELLLITVWTGCPDSYSIGIFESCMSQ